MIYVGFRKNNLNAAVQPVLGVLFIFERSEANQKRNDIIDADDVVMERHSRQGVPTTAVEIFQLVLFGNKKRLILLSRTVRDSNCNFGEVVA